MKADAVLKAVMGEYHEAIRIHPPFNNRHEGYAVLLEEVDELWAEIKKRDPSMVILAREATHIAAMAIRFAVDCCDTRRDSE